MPSQTVTAQCVNPNDMMIKVEMEMSLPQWRYILRMTDHPVPYYAPLEDIRQSVSEAIRGIETAVKITAKDGE